MKIAIVGAGISGLACADALSEAGLRVSLYDKGRGPGGRLATRRIQTPCGEAAFDHGAQYFTVRSPGFTALVDTWEKDGAASRWPIAGVDAWVGTPGMSAVVRAMAQRHDVSFGVAVTGIDRTANGWIVRHAGGQFGPFDALVLAIPAEQAAALLSLHDFEMAQVALLARSQPCWTGMYAFADTLAAPDTPVRDTKNISWAVRNRAKPVRSGPETWVVQAQPEWSRARLDQPAEKIARELLTHLNTALGEDLPEPIAASAHRWRYAMSSGTGDEALWCPGKGIGACGDWLIAPRVESAWHSGRTLGARMLDSLPTDCAAAADQKQ